MQMIKKKVSPENNFKVLGQSNFNYGGGNDW
jgi:hypothetical protein